MNDIWRRIANGQGRMRDLDMLEDVAANIGGKKTLCSLGDFAAGPVLSAIMKFRPDFERLITEGRPAEPVPLAAG
jgi:NADH-quinone oxidoreductase subunit F